MKVFDILSEAPLDPNELKRRRERAAAANQNLNNIAAQREKASADSAARRQKAADIRAQNPVAAKAKDIGKPLAKAVKNPVSTVGTAINKATTSVSPKSGKVTGDIGQYITGKQKSWRTNQKLFARLEAKWMRLYGTPLTWLMKLLGVGTALTFLYLDLESFEQEYAAGQFDKAQYEAGREFLFGTFMVQILTPAILRRLSQTFIVAGIVRAITWVAGGLSAGVTAGASVAALVASEAFFAWFQGYLSTGAGKDWLVNWVGTNIIRTMGKVPEGAWSALTDAYKKADQAKLQKQDPAKAAAVAKQEKQDASDLEKAQAFRKELERGF